MYVIHDVIDQMTGNHLFLIFMTIGWIGGSVQFLEGIRLAWRDKVPGLPIAYLCAIVAHDSSVALNYTTWFDTEAAQHWYFTGTWYLYPFWACIEVVCIVWFVRLAHREIATDLPAWAYYCIFGLFQITAIVLFHLLDSLLDDPLHIFGLAIAQIVNIVFFIPMLLRRKSTLGQSRIQAAALLFGPGSFGLLAMATMSSAFQTSVYYAMVACITLLALAYIVLLEFYRHREQPALAGSL